MDHSIHSKACERPEQEQCVLSEIACEALSLNTDTTEKKVSLFTCCHPGLFLSCLCNSSVHQFFLLEEEIPTKRKF